MFLAAVPCVGASRSPSVRYVLMSLPSETRPGYAVPAGTAYLIVMPEAVR